MVVIQADQILFYPDFRSHERGYQLLTQVAGRAGRRSEKGNVIIQAYAMNHPILLQVIDQNYIEFFNLEIQDRHIFAYPPFTRLIRLELRHTKPNILAAGCDLLQKRLTGLLDKKYILGPAEPHISRIKGAYIKEFIIKLEKEKIDSAKFKSKLREELLSLKATEGYSSIRLKIDVDPY